MYNEFLIATGFESPEDEKFSQYQELHSDDYFDDNIDQYISDRSDEILELINENQQLTSKLERMFWEQHEDIFRENFEDRNRGETNE